jgi:DAACS family dicarboxylate/amino acid:cation (Na+ or H+) symporter
MKLWVKILIALLIGVFVGGLMHHYVRPEAPILMLFKTVGDGFLRLISMIIVLLVLSSMSLGITSIHDPQKLGRVGGKTLLLYLSTTIAAILIGYGFAKVLKPGAGMNLVATSQKLTEEVAPSIWEILLSIIPSNPVVSMVEGNILQIIVFSLFLGISINFAGERGKPLKNLLESVADVMYRMTSIIMEFSPIGVFAIMTYVIGTFGLAPLWNLSQFLFAYYAACLFHVLVVFCSLLWFVGGLHPWPFFRGMRDAIMMAFSTSSSSATLPVSMHCVKENLGVTKNITSFVMPLGSTVNMNGAAIFQGMAAIFIAQVYNIELEWYNVLTLVITATFSAIGAAGIPGSGFIMLTVTFASVGIPIEGLALLAGIDRIREMGSTVLNILGDAVCAVVIAKQEGELDERQYYHEKLVEVEGYDL